MPDHPDMPDNIKSLLEQHPDLVKSLSDPDFINKINQGLRPGLANADWCVACGASAARAPETAVSNPDPISAKDIEAMGQRLIAHARSIK